jgi:hypothetical protein
MLDERGEELDRFIEVEAVSDWRIHRRHDRRIEHVGVKVDPKALRVAQNEPIQRRTGDAGRTPLSDSDSRKIENG